MDIDLFKMDLPRFKVYLYHKPLEILEIFYFFSTNIHFGNPRFFT